MGECEAILRSALEENDKSVSSHNVTVLNPNPFAKGCLQTLPYRGAVGSQLLMRAYRDHEACSKVSPWVSVALVYDAKQQNYLSMFSSIRVYPGQRTAPELPVKRDSGIAFALS